MPAPPAWTRQSRAVFHNENNSGLLRLPRELRDTIWKFAVLPRHGVCLKSAIEVNGDGTLGKFSLRRTLIEHENHVQTFAIVRTLCRMSKDEATPLFFQGAVFTVSARQDIVLKEGKFPILSKPLLPCSISQIRKIRAHSSFLARFASSTAVGARGTTSFVRPFIIINKHGNSTVSASWETSLQQAVSAKLLGRYARDDILDASIRYDSDVLARIRDFGPGEVNSTAWIEHALHCLAPGYWVTGKVVLHEELRYIYDRQRKMMDALNTWEPEDMQETMWEVEELTGHMQEVEGFSWNLYQDPDVRLFQSLLQGLARRVQASKTPLRLGTAARPPTVRRRLVKNQHGRWVQSSKVGSVADLGMSFEGAI